MKKLLSLPPDIASEFHALTGYSHDEWFSTSDPIDKRLGSGGGTTWTLDQWEKNGGNPEDKKVLIHAGGQSRRLPAYASIGKVLTPIPVFRWEAGQRIDQTLLDLQMPLYERIMAKAPHGVNTLIASGDVYIRATQPLQEIPQADVICYGLWVNPVLASHHGVFASRIESPQTLDMMLQKPSLEQQAELSSTHIFLMDIGVWLLSDKAVKLLRNRSMDANGELKQYDLYSEFGGALGKHPHVKDDELNKLTVAILPLPGGEFYHFGTTNELLSSTLALQSIVSDQRKLLSRGLKPHPSMFVQNCRMDYKLTSDNSNVWIENAHIAKGWELTRNNVVTGVPVNDWSISLHDGICLDICPVEGGYAVRPYGYNDAMRGKASSITTTFMGIPLAEWLENHDYAADLEIDIQALPLFPVIDNIPQMGVVAEWMLAPNPDKNHPGAELYHKAEKLSADKIMERADLKKLFAQRRAFLDENIKTLADNHSRSVMYQVDLLALSDYMASRNLESPASLPDDAPLIKRISNFMLRYKLTGDTAEEQKAWALMRSGILANSISPADPQLDVRPDQIVWGRSPVRIDVAGGWTDTPPYSLSYGGNVVNVAMELNGQAPLQAFVKPCAQPHIILRSIDLGAEETITTYEQLLNFAKIGSPFSIPKAALVLAGFGNEFSQHQYSTLKSRLEHFGCGMEITLLSAVGAGSGLGTSSILAATVLGALNNFCALGWDNGQICRATLALEQLLTTGGGWQDQYGGVLPGVKLLQSAPGLLQDPAPSWLPSLIFTDAEYAPCHILYYTGITRTAKTILAEIVRGMALNSRKNLGILSEMKELALSMAATIQRRQWPQYAALVKESWELNKRLDSGTNPPSVEAIIDLIKDYAAGYKLPGAGGGGYLYIVAKDPQAAATIREILNAAHPNPRARIVDMRVSSTGMQISRS